MFNGFRSPANLNSFNAPPSAGITATGGTITTYPANPRTNYFKNPLSNISSSTNVLEYGGSVFNFATGPVDGSPNKIYMYSYQNSGYQSAYYYFGLNGLVSGNTYCISFYLDFPYISYYVSQGYDYWGTPIGYYTTNSYMSVLYSESGSSSTIYSTQSTGGRVKVSNTFTYNGGTNPKIGFLFTFNNNLGTTYNISLDSPIVELGLTTGSYFYGGSADCHWNGSVNASSSSQNQYKVHTFTSNGDFNISSLGYNADLGKVDYLVVAGGGSGGPPGGGGGGAGGMLTGTNLTVSATNYPIVVGAGGTGTAYPSPGNNGQNSTALGLTAIGGGGGGSTWGNGTNNEAGGKAGGSGGGAGINSNYIASGGAGTAGQGNKGGDGAYPA